MSQNHTRIFLLAEGRGDQMAIRPIAQSIMAEKGSADPSGPKMVGICEKCIENISMRVNKQHSSRRKPAA
jgi:hypothetical protein